MRNFKQQEFKLMTDLTKEELPIIRDLVNPTGPLHLEMCKVVDFTSKYQLPVVKPMTDLIVPERLCSLHRIKSAPKDIIPGTCVHHFTQDSNIEPLWTRCNYYANFLRQFDFVLSPDFSVYMEMVEIQKWWNDFRNKFLAAYFQYLNVNIIPAPSWADKKDIDRYAEGWPIGSVIAINSTGINRDKRSIHNWLDCYFMITDILKPIHILRYGRLIEGEKVDISTS